MKLSVIIPNYNNDIYLKDHMGEWIDLHSRNISIKTKESYENQIEAYINPYLGDYKMKELNPKIIEEFEQKTNKAIEELSAFYKQL